jgi:NAD(P)H-hydrate epimerase
LVSAAEMRAAEQEAATRGLSSAALMQLAGRGAAQALLAAPGARAARYLVLAGPGNNGGDALVVARLLAGAGAQVEIVTYRRAQAAGDPAGIPRFASGEDTDGARLRAALAACDVLVDGILGTGRSRPPEPDLQALLRAVQEAPGRRRVVALDLPTGVDADSGAADPLTLHADETLVFGYAKRGLLLYPARAHC